MINTFRKADLEDIPLIRDLAEKSWKSAYNSMISAGQIDFMLDQMYSAKEISSHLKNPDYRYYIVESDSAPAGFLGFEYHYEKNTTKLHRIYLLENFKGKGLGKSSLAFLKNEVSLSTDRRIILNVNKSNPAKEMYEHQGFKVYDEGIFDIGNGFVMDDFLMECFV